MKSSILFASLSFLAVVVFFATVNDAVAQSGRPSAPRPQSGSMGSQGHRPSSGGQYYPSQPSYQSYPSRPMYGHSGAYMPPKPHHHGGYGYGGYVPQYPYHGGYGYGGYLPPHHPPVAIPAPAPCHHPSGVVVRIGGFGVFIL